MKRSLNPGHNRPSHDWTPEEDQSLIHEVDNLKSSNWRIITKIVNKQFKGKWRTAKDCEQRWKEISHAYDHDSEPKPWTEAEDLALLFALYFTPDCWETLLPARPDLRTHLGDMLLNVAAAAKEGHSATERKSPTQILRSLVCLQLMMESLEGRDTKGFPQAGEAVRAVQLEFKDCFNLLRSLDLPVKITASSDLPRFRRYLGAVMQTLFDKLYTTIGSTKEDDELTHQRQPRPARLRYCWVRLPSVGYYFLARYAA